MQNIGQGIQTWIAFSPEGSVQGFAGQMGFTGQCGHIPDPGGGHVVERYLEQLYVTFRVYPFKMHGGGLGIFQHVLACFFVSPQKRMSLETPLVARRFRGQATD